MADKTGMNMEDRWRMFARSNHHYVDQPKSVIGYQFLKGLRTGQPEIYLRARILPARVKIKAPIGERVLV